MIRWTYAFIDRPSEGFALACSFWQAVTGTRLSERCGPRREFATLLPEGADPAVTLQAVDGAGGAHQRPRKQGRS